MTSPRPGYESAVVAVPTKPDLSISPVEQRRHDSAFIARCAIDALAGRLPLPWPTPPKTPPSPKRHYRSHYEAPNPNTLLELDDAAWAALGPIQLVLKLVDFCGLRPVLAALLYKPTARGHVPFDPVSLFLLCGWQLINRWNRTETLRYLADERYADYATAFGFQPGCYPTESGLRYFLTTIGEKDLNALIEQSIDLIRRAGLIPSEVVAEAIVSFDGMLHDAASRMCCSAVQESCYQPTSPEQPRPCPAKEKGQRGCSCETIACQTCCSRATPRDPDARFVWYEGANRSDHPNASASTPPSAAVSTGAAAGKAPPPKSSNGEGRYGYRSLPATLIDFVQRTTWILAAAKFVPANAGHEADPAAALLRWVVAAYPWLQVRVAVGDAGLGYEPFLATCYELHVRRVVDLRAHPTDKDKDGWTIRGYDDKGCPICLFGYRLHPNGFDETRHRSKWCCRQRCEAPSIGDDLPTLTPECLYRDRTAHRFGFIKDVGKTFADGSLRLVRDVPYRSAAWNEIYRRARNAAESRNANLRRWQLKRLPVFGMPRSKATIFLADVWTNLTSMARLVQEATLAQRAPELAAA